MESGCTFLSGLIYGYTDPSFGSGKIVYQAESTRSILSDVSNLYVPLLQPTLKVVHRRTNVLQFTFTTLIEPRFWITIDSKSPPSDLFLNTLSKFLSHHSSATALTSFHSFLILFILFVVALEFNERDRVNVPETIFMVYALGFTLEKVAAMQEHGIKGISCPSNVSMKILFLTLFIHSLLQGYMGK